MEEFGKAIVAVEVKYTALLNSRKYEIGALPKVMPGKGVYLFSVD